MRAHRAADWKAGWLESAARCESPNRNARPAGTRVSLVVIHSISLPPGEFGGDAIEQLFTNQLDWNAHPYFQTIHGLTVSAHFLIRRDGRVIQFVSCDERAWHAGESIWRGRSGCNDFSVGVELEGLEGETFEAEQYARLAALLEQVHARYPIESVAGHEDIAPGRKVDPGQGFDWPRLRAMLAWPATFFDARQDPSSVD